MGTAKKYDNLSDAELADAKAGVGTVTLPEGLYSKGDVVNNTVSGQRVLDEQRNNYDNEVSKRNEVKVQARTAELYKTRGAVPAVATAVTSSGESTDAPVVDREGEVELGSGYSGTPSSRRRGRFRSGSGSISI